MERAVFDRCIKILQIPNTPSSNQMQFTAYKIRNLDDKIHLKNLCPIVSVFD